MQLPSGKAYIPFKRIFLLQPQVVWGRQDMDEIFKFRSQTASEDRVALAVSSSSMAVG
jgi:hypothetical protein